MANSSTSRQRPRSQQKTDVSRTARAPSRVQQATFLAKELDAYPGTFPICPTLVRGRREARLVSTPGNELPEIARYFSRPAGAGPDEPHYLCRRSRPKGHMGISLYGGKAGARVLIYQFPALHNVKRRQTSKALS